MNRKSTVLIAALVNGAFLVALFSTAIRSHESETKMASPHLQAEVKAAPPLSTDGPGYHHPTQAHNPPALELPDPLLKDVPELKAQAPLATAPAQKKKPQTQNQGTSSSEGAFIEIEVKKGDVLERIARANGTSVSTLMEINALKSPWLKIGQKLRVPKNSSSKGTSPIDSSPEFYTVKKGDNLWIIASKFKVSVSDLKRLNHLDDESAKRLRVNDQLRIR